MANEDNVPLHCLSYVSTSNIPAEGVTDFCDSIMRAAAVTNAKLNITGYLLYRAGYFIQLLEGSRDNLDYLYGIISTDSSHRDLKILFFNEIQERYFKHWSMGYSVASKEEDEVLSKFLEDKIEKEGVTLNPKDIIDLINHVRQFTLKTKKDPPAT